MTLLLRLFGRLPLVVWLVHGWIRRTAHVRGYAQAYARAVALVIRMGPNHPATLAAMDALLESAGERT